MFLKRYFFLIQTIEIMSCIYLSCLLHALYYLKKGNILQMKMKIRKTDHECWSLSYPERIVKIQQSIFDACYE